MHNDPCDRRCLQERKARDRLGACEMECADVYPEAVQNGHQGQLQRQHQQHLPTPPQYSQRFWRGWPGGPSQLRDECLAAYLFIYLQSKMYTVRILKDVASEMVVVPPI